MDEKGPQLHYQQFSTLLGFLTIVTCISITHVLTHVLTFDFLI